MKTKYFYTLVLGILMLTNTVRSQNILFDGDFSQTIEIVPFDTSTPPINIWALGVNSEYGAEANSSIVEGVAKFLIVNPGYYYWDVQLAQFGFPLTQGHIYNLSFDVRADSDRFFGVYLGEAGLNNNIIGYSVPIYTASNEWQTVSVDFESNIVFGMNQLSFGIGSDSSTIYFDNIALTDLGPSILTEVNLIGNLQEEMGCGSSYDSECEYSKLALNTSSGLWEGSFFLPEGCYLYRVNEKFSYHEVPYGENGVEWGEEIQLYLPVDSEIKFSYDPTTHLISSTPFSGNSEKLTEISLIGNFQEEIGCNYDYEPDCEISTLEFNAESGMWEGSFVIPAGCYFYQVKEAFGCEEILYGENGLEGSMIELYVPSDGEVTFIYDPQTHITSSTPYSGVPQDVTKVSLVGSFQNEMGCEFDYDNFCDILELQFNSSSGIWEGSFTIPAGCYFYEVKETSACDFRFYGENGEQGGQNIPLYIPTESEILFSYDPQTHLIVSNPFSGIPQEITSVSLIGTLQDELGCSYDNDSECDKPALHLNPETGLWQGSFVLPEGCYTYMVKQKFACDAGVLYGAGGQESGDEIELYVSSEGEITFSYHPETHIISSSPYGEIPTDMTKVSLIGNLQDELGCAYDGEEDCENTLLEFNIETGIWEGTFDLPAGCYSYRVKEESVCNTEYYGESGGEIQLYIPSNGEISFRYDPETHAIFSTPYSGVPQEVTEVSLVGSLQNELGCASDDDFYCEKPALSYNSASGFWEGSFILPAGCYDYKIEERFGCNEGILFGENGQESGEPIQLYVPSNGEITFSYDPQTHLINSTPYADVPPEMTKVSLSGTLQDELGCADPWVEDCENSALKFNSASGIWEASFVLPAGCYFYWVKESTECGTEYYGENGQIQLYVPEEAEITFSYDPQTHKVNSTPYIGVPQEITSVSLTGTFQEEFGCESINNPECDQPGLVYDPDSAKWKGTFTLSAGCHAYWVKETFGCDYTLYGENGSYGGDQIQLYMPEEGEASFSYDPETRIITSTPYSGIPQEVTAVSLMGNPGDRALQFNPVSGLWETSFSLPEGCYYYQVKETSICKEAYYGENGYEWSVIELYIPTESEISFSYDPETHLMNTSPYSGVPEEVTSVALLGYFGDSVSYPSLTKNESSGNWEGSFELPAGCYTYWVVETVACRNSYLYGENGEAEAYGGKVIQLYIPESGEVSFIYDPQTHIMTSTPYSGAPQDVSKVSITIYPNELDLNLNPDSGKWEGSVELAAGCYSYEVRETLGCEETSYGGNLFYLPLSGEITFRYNPETHITNTTPYSGVPEEVTNVNLIGYLDGEYGSIPLSKNDVSGKWEGTYMAPAGCYAYRIQEIQGCSTEIIYGEDGEEWGNELQLYVPSETEITFSYDPETHLITSLPYFDISDVNQCPEDIYVDNTPGTCGAIVDYPGFVVTAYCGGDVSSVTQTAGFPSGSEFPIGTTTNTYELVKTTGEVINCSFDVVVIDMEAPVITDLNETYAPLWPPNHKMVPVYIEYVSSDNCNIASTELFISSNEPQTGRGKGDQAPDWQIVDAHNILLRAERDPKGTGRQYYITIKVNDNAGNFKEEVITVKVPLNNSKAAEEMYAADSGNDPYVLYPTPANDVVKIKGTKSVSGSPYSIYDMLGVMKLGGIIRNEMVEVFSLPNGTYVLQFTTDKGTVSKQFIKN